MRKVRIYNKKCQPYSFSDGETTAFEVATYSFAIGDNPTSFGELTVISANNKSFGQCLRETFGDDAEIILVDKDLVFKDFS